MATISRSGIAASSIISATHITNIIDALDGSGSAVTIIATGSFSGSFRGNLTGTSSWASNATLATNATTAATATSVAYSGITSLPAGISINGGVSVVDDVIAADAGGPFIVSASNVSVLRSGRFYSVSAKFNPVTIYLDDAGTGGTEYTFFAKDVANPITFATASISHSIISENGYLSMYGTGSAVTAKQIGSGPVIWALIGSLKA